MKKSIIFLSFIAGCIFLPSCNNNGDDENNYPDPLKIDLSDVEMKMTDESQNFATNLFSVIHELKLYDSESENIAISPLSLNLALAMAWNGATGETKKAIQEAMGMGNYPQSEVNDYFKKLQEEFVKIDPIVKLAIANSIWSKLGFPVKQGFYDVNKNFYNTEVKEVDFTSPATLNLINQWCSDNTNGLIKEMLKEIPSNVVMYLINALYFKGEWSDNFSFDPSTTRDATFTKENGSSIKVKMMSQSNKLPYYRDEYLSTTSLPFGNNAFSMVFILPDEKVSFSGMLNQLKQPGYFAKCLQTGNMSEVDLFIPKFKTEYEILLNETLEQLGMGIAFSGAADFSGISDSPDRVNISDVIQKTFVSVDEKGGEAAAVTAVIIETLSYKKMETFYADRPFLFAIRENSTGVILFMGKIGKPGV
jgi:serpin B